MHAARERGADLVDFADEKGDEVQITHLAGHLRRELDGPVAAEEALHHKGRQREVVIGKQV